MIRIDDTLLEEIGLIVLPKPDRDQLLRQIYETLEMRVGMRLAERMTDQQLDEFERFIDTNDEAGALKWLETNFPDYKQVVADELEKLKTEIKKDAPKIIEAMQSQVGAVPQPAQLNTPPGPAAAPLQAAPVSQPQATMPPQTPPAYTPQPAAPSPVQPSQPVSWPSEPPVAIPTPTPQQPTQSPVSNIPPPPVVDDQQPPAAA